MSRFLSALPIAFCLALTSQACSAPAGSMDVADVASDAVADNGDTAAMCRTDLDCTDHVFCNGAERCSPGAGADARGCVAANPASPCMTGQTCDETAQRCMGCATDADGDGHRAPSCGGDDCDDADPNRYPGNPEVCDSNGHDEDCNASTLGPDADGDGFPPVACCDRQADGSVLCGRDCDDLAATINPSATETCDGRDNDCNGLVDDNVRSQDYYPDCDGDRFGAMSATPVHDCAPPMIPPVSCPTAPASMTWVAGNNTDCDDANLRTNTSAPEVCDGTDNNCDGAIDEDPAASVSCPAALHTTTQLCVSGSCVATACETAFHVCGSACVSSRNIATCGTSCTPCPVGPSHSTASCDGTSCGFVCDSGYYAVSGACAALPPPRAVAPLSTSIVTSRRPTLRWELPAGVDGASVDLCSDRACATILATLAATGTSVAPTSDLPPGVVYWRLHGRAGTSVGSTTSVVWQFSVGTRSAPIDTSWGSMHDVNGDGHADVVVGDEEADTTTGRAYVYLGSALGLSTMPEAALVGDSPGGEFAYAIAQASDVNGDGYGDVIIGADNSNRAFVYYGGPSGIDAARFTRIDGPPTGANSFGYKVSDAGDVDRDGYGDVLVLAQGSGIAYLYRGSAAGIDPTPAIVDGAGDVSAIGSAGDFNGDGYGDVATSHYSSTLRAYVAVVYAGGPSGPSATAAATLTLAPGDPADLIAGTDADGDGRADLVAAWRGTTGSPGTVMVFRARVGGYVTPPTTLRVGTTSVDDGAFGASIATGDVDRDGYWDLVIGAPYLGTSPSFHGRIYFYRGSATGIASAPTATFDGANGSYLGDSVAACDVDGDGFEDAVVSARGADSVVMFRGSATGLMTSVPALTAPPGSVDWSWRLALESHDIARHPRVLACVMKT